MPLILVVHNLDNPAAPDDVVQAFNDSLWQVSSTHWQVAPGATLVGTSVSPAYLKDLILRAMRRAGGEPGLLLVTPVAENACWHGLSAENEAWIRETAE